MKRVWVMLGAVAAVALLVTLFFVVGGSDDGRAPARVPPAVPVRVTPVPDGGLYRHPHPDRFRLRYSPHP